MKTPDNSRQKGSRVQVAALWELTWSYRWRVLLAIVSVVLAVLLVFKVIAWLLGAERPPDWTGFGDQPALAGHLPVSVGTTAKTL